jgi:acetolactate synthase-1/2/3 large subunit
LFAGVAGAMSNRGDGTGVVANELIRGADCLLVLGSRMDGLTTLSGELPGESTFTIRVDVDPEQLALSPRDNVSVQADARAAVEAMIEFVPVPGTPPAPPASLADLWSGVRQAQDDLMATDAVPIAPARLFGGLRRCLTRDHIVVCDASYPSIWAVNYLQEGRHFEQMTYARAGGTLGFGLPAALGTACAFPDRQVVALVGDGGLGFGWSEFETIAREQANVVTVVLNNGCFAWQKIHHQHIGGVATPRGLGFADVHHDRLAAVVGISGYRVEHPGELDGALQSAFDEGGPAVVDVVIDPELEPPLG